MSRHSTDNSRIIAVEKSLQKRYYATIDIFITLIIRILESKFTNLSLHYSYWERLKKKSTNQ